MLLLKRSISSSSRLSLLTRVSANRKPSPIRSLIPLAQTPGMLNLGGGSPNTDSFPISSLTIELKEESSMGGKAKTIVLEGSRLASALQYTNSYGYPELVPLLKGITVHEHSPRYAEWEMCVTTGSQEALAKTFEMLLEKEDTLIVEDPTYCGALSALHPIECNLAEVATDNDGLVPEKLEELLDQWPEGKKKPKALYIIPTGQNPSGTTLSQPRREHIYKLACKHDLIILEDDPYWFLNFNFGKDGNKSFFSMDTEERVLRFDSMSKLISSGLRVGTVCGPKWLIENIQLHQQSSCLHASALSQAVLASILHEWGTEGWESHLSRIQDMYRVRRDLFVQSASKHLTGLAEWTVPSAGMFSWIKLEGISDTKELLNKRAVEKKFLMVPGASFSASNTPSSYVRASFSTASAEDIDEALRRLKELLLEERERR